MPAYGKARGNLRRDFADSNCATALATSDARCPPFDFAIRLASPGCHSRARVFRAGAAYAPDAGVFQSLDDGGCGSASLGPFAAQSSLPKFTSTSSPSRLPPLRRQRRARSNERYTRAAREIERGGELRADTWLVPGGARVEWAYRSTANLRDTAQDTECALQKARDGKLRCVPRAASASRFADAACTIPIANVWKEECTAPKFGVVNVGTGCGTRGSVRPLLGKRASNSAYTLNAASTCVADEIPTIYEAFDLGPERPDSDWQELTETRE